MANQAKFMNETLVLITDALRNLKSLSCRALIAIAPIAAFIVSAMPLDLIAAPTQKSTINKIQTPPNESEGKNPTLEQQESLRFPPSESTQNIGPIPRTHIVTPSFFAGLSYKYGNFYESQSKTSSLGLNFAWTHLNTVDDGLEVGLTVFNGAWTQISVAKKMYLNGTTRWRPFWTIQVGGVLVPNENLGSIISYKRYFIGSKIGTEFMIGRTALKAEIDAQASLLGPTVQTSIGGLWVF
jgi:hypothetical protein